MSSLLKLECPLCCNETFNSHDSLKYHLLSIIDNLLCPSCGQRFEKIHDLADHLGRKCKNSDEEVVEFQNQILSEEVVKLETMQSEDAMETTENGTNLQNSILAKALLQNAEHSDKEENEIQDGNQEKEMFYCSSCSISFPSVSDHLEKYHKGQTVYVEDNEQPQESTEENSEVFLLEGKQSTMDSNENEETIEVISEGQSIEHQYCYDKEGILYERKVVPIEKFWDEEKVPDKQSPIMLPYILEEGKARKAEGEDLDNLGENQKLLIIYQCPHCNVHFSKLPQYQNHNCNTKSNSSKYQCNRCDSTFNNVKCLNGHMRSHKLDKTVESSGPYICEDCNTEFPSYKSLRLHKRMHEPVKVKDIEPPVNYGIMGDENEYRNEEEREMFVCEICKNTYDKQYEEVHMRSHLEEEKFDCNTCNRKFFTQSNLDMHMRVHTSGKKFSCSHCKKEFLTYESLQEHVNSKCQYQSKSYACSYCGRRFFRPHEKVKHERIHTGEKPHVCTICGKAFRVSYCLTLHMRTHSGTRPYQCAECGKRFKAHSVYNHHLLTHSNIRNYKCPYCPKTFKTGVQLAGHKNSHIKPFTCTECNRPFASLYAVRAHMESHFRENNLKYNCSECGASYARAFALRDHIKAHHPGINTDRVETDLLPDYEMAEMVVDDVNVENNILTQQVAVEGVDDNVLVQFENGEIGSEEMVEAVEVAAEC